MSASAQVIDKIKKLLRLARSSNQHEAQLAMQRALALAREHDIAVDSLNPDEQAKEKTITHRDSAEVQRMSYDKEYAVRIIQAFFHVSPVFNCRLVRPLDGYPYVARFVTFVGTAADAEIALYVYGFLVQHFAYCWRKHRGRLRNRHAFVDGMFLGLFYKLAENQPPHHAKGNELVLAGHRSYIEAIVGKTEKSEFKEPDGDAKAAKYAGYIQGQNTNIAPALKPGESTAPAVLALR